LGQRPRERDRELDRRVAAGLDRGALAGDRILDGTARDRARAIAADLDDQPGDDRRLLLQPAGRGLDDLRFRRSLAHMVSLPQTIRRATGCARCDDRTVETRPVTALLVLAACGRLDFGQRAVSTDSPGSPDTAACGTVELCN